MVEPAGVMLSQSAILQRYWPAVLQFLLAHVVMPPLIPFKRKKAISFFRALFIPVSHSLYTFAS